MSQQSNQYRKVFIDSRWRTSGTHGDFTIELPRDLATSRTASVYIASCSFSNTFSTIEPGVNDEFYFLSEDPQSAPPFEEDDRYFYALYQRDQVVRVSSGAEQLYLMIRVQTGENQFTYQYTMATLVPGLYEVSAFADQLQTAVRAMIGGDTATVTWNAASETYVVTFLPTPNPNLSWFIPGDRQLRSLVNGLGAQPAPRSAPLWPPNASTLNAVLNIPNFAGPGGAFTPAMVPFGSAQTTGRVATERPINAILADLSIRAPTQRPLGIADVAAHLQFHLRFWLSTLTVVPSESGLTFDTGTLGWTLRLLSDSELRDWTWRNNNWPGPRYSTENPQSYNLQLGITPGQQLLRNQTLPPLPPFRQSWVFRLPRTQYNDGADLALSLQALIRNANSDATVAFDSTSGTLLFVSPPPVRIRIPTERELRKPEWRKMNWDPYLSNGPDARYDMNNPTSLNGQIYMPSPSEYTDSVESGNIDLAPYRELYLASSITNFRTMQAGTGRMDYMARIPIEVNYGQVNTFRAYNTDAIAVSDMNFRTVSFSFRDWAGRLAPLDQPAIIELSFLDSDPHSL